MYFVWNDNFYPVQFESELLPFPVVGMSDVMPYPSTRYRDLTDEMFAQWYRNISDISLWQQEEVTKAITAMSWEGVFHKMENFEMKILLEEKTET